MINIKNKISGIILLSLIIITVVSILVTGIFWFNDIVHSYQNDIVSLNNDFIDQQKSLVKQEVENAVNYIEYYRLNAESSLKETIKNRMKIAIEITSNIYEENKDTKNTSEIKKLVKDALRPIRFNEGRGYYFAVSMDGVEELYPVFPELEGLDLIDLKDDKGNYVIRDEIEIVNSLGEGFLIDYWKKPELNDGMIYPKITYVMKFEPLNWYLGTGEYLDEVEKDLQKEVIERLAEIRFGDEGYVFLNKFDGTQLITNGELVTEKRNLVNIFGMEGKLVLEQEIKAAKTHEGEFIYYSWNKMGKEEPVPKISFIKGVPDWEWIIGAGFYLDDLNEQISLLENEQKKKIVIDMIQILGTLLGLLLLSVLIARWLFKRINKNFEVFENFFIFSAKEMVKINKDKLHYMEFRKLADLANKMIEEHVKDKQIIIESELKYRNLVDNQGEGVVIGDLKENIEFANPAAEKILGINADKIIGMNMSEFLSGSEFKKLKKQTSNRLKGISSTYDMVLTRPDGEAREIMITATPLYDHNKKVIGSIGIFRDITERNIAKRELEQSRQHLKLINKILRHDLANHLIAIQSGLNLYKKLKKQEFYDITFNKIDSSIELIRKMKEFESINYYQRNLIPVNITEIISKIKMIYVDTRIEIQGEEATVLANESFFSIIDNIISNAITHGGADRILIDVSTEDGDCIIKISDYGSGIPDAIKKKIFNEGFKYSKTGKSGLGLYIVKEALNILDGTIEVVDNKPSGTTFIIKLKTA